MSLQRYRHALSRSGRLPGLLLGLLAILALCGCGSPQQGSWSGTFDGDLEGIVNFEINRRGTKVTGAMDGKTSSGEPFKAKIKGTLRVDFLDATFEGAGAAGQGVPVAFEGRMTGSLKEATGVGDWEATIRLTGSAFRGTFSVTQNQASD